MKLSIDIDDADLNEAIQKGIKGLSEETITGLAKEAVVAYLQTQSGIESVLYRSKRNYYDSNELRPELLEMLRASFTKEEVEKYRSILFEVMEKQGGNLIIRTLANVFVSMLMTEDAKNQFRYELIQIVEANKKQ